MEVQHMAKRFFALLASVGLLMIGAVPATAANINSQNAFVVTNLQSDVPGRAAHTDPDLVKALKRATSGGPDLAIEAVGKPEVQEQALSVVRTGGRLVLLGFAAKPMSVQGGRVTFRELEIIGTLGCRNIDFPVVIDLVRRGKLAITPLVSHRHRLEEVNAGFDALRAGVGIRHIVVME